MQHLSLISEPFFKNATNMQKVTHVMMVNLTKVVNG